MYLCTVIAKDGVIHQYVAENATDGVNYADTHYPHFKKLVAISGNVTLIKRG